MNTKGLLVLAVCIGPVLSQGLPDGRPGAATRLGDAWSPPQVVTPIHTQADDPEGIAYGIWAAGQDYKVSFHDGATFVPYLGGDYPRNQPFGWTTTSVTIAGEELVKRKRPVGRQVSGTRYEYDHGDVVEAYDVLLEGLEQTFVIARAPAQFGDLVVRGKVDSALSAGPVTSMHTGVRFVDHNGDPILTYGAATAIDASGRTRAMTTTYADGRFEIELDAAWLRDAIFPVVVDPLLQNNVLLNSWGASSGWVTDLDVLREDERSTENVWISYTRQVSATDSDLWVMRTNDNLPGSLFVQAFSDITSSWGNEGCALAHANSRVVCAFTRVFGLAIASSGVNRSIRWHAHHVNDLAIRTGVGALPGSTRDWRVDAGGNRARTGSDRVIVVYQHEPSPPNTQFANTSTSQCLGFYVDLAGVSSTTGQGVVASAFAIRPSAATDSERPRVNQVADGFGNNHWCVVHQVVDSNNPGDDWDVFIDIWNETGGLQDRTTLEPANGMHKLGPVVAGSGGRYLVVFGESPVAAGGPTSAILAHHLRTQRVDFNGAQLSLPHPPHTYLTSSVRNLETRSVSYNTNTQSHWLAVSRSDNALYADLLGYRGRTTEFDNFIQGPGGATTVRAAACSFDDDNDTFVLVGAEFAVGSHPIRGNVWSNQTIPRPTTAGAGCSSANLVWAPQALRPNSQKIGHEFSGVTLHGVPPGALSMVGVSLSAVSIPIGTIPGVGTGCNQLINTSAGFLGFLPIGFGSPGFGSVRWDLPLDENFWPVTLHFQAFHLDASSSVFLATQRLSVPIGY